MTVDVCRFVRGRGAAAVVALFAGAGLLFFLYTHGRVLRPEWMAPLIAWAAVAAVVERMRARYRPDGMSEESPGDSGAWRLAILVLLGFALLYLFSSTAREKWFYFLDWVRATRGGLCDLKSGIFLFAMLTVVLTPLVLFGIRDRAGIMAGAMLVLQALALYAFLGTIGDKGLYNDDHPSFMYRLWLFGRSFPQVINYSPFWNAGEVDTAALSTGVNAPGLLFWPFWKNAPMLEFYPVALGVMYIVVVPLLAVASVRIMGFGWTAAFGAGILGLGISRHFFLWLLNYGTVGANFVSAFIMPVTACVYRIVVLGRMEKWVVAALALAASFLILWPPGALMLLPVAAAFLFGARHWSAKKWIFLAVCGTAALALGFRQIAYVLTMTDVTSHDWVRSAGPVAPFCERLGKGWDALHWHCMEGHPLLIFLGLGGAIVVGWRNLRAWFLPILAGFALLAGWGPEWAPDLQLSRMALPLFFVAVLPAAVLTGEILGTRHPRLALARAAVLALLLVGGWNVAQLYARKGPGGYEFLAPEIKDLAEWVRKNTSKDGRVMLAGPTGHQYGGGHVTFLPVLFEREMVSSEWRHGQKADLRQGSPPEWPPARPEDLTFYLEAFAVHTILTVDDEWTAALRSDPTRFEESATFRNISAFKVRQPSGLMLKGQGNVRARVNVITVTLSEPGDEAVIRYRWEDGLSASGGAELFPFHAGRGVRLIGIRPSREREIRIVYRRWL